MKVVVLLHLFLEGIKAVIFEEVSDIIESEIKIVYSDEAPSLLSCTQRCYLNNAVVNFDPPFCQCFVYIKKTKIPIIDFIQFQTLSGMFYRVGIHSVFVVLAILWQFRRGSPQIKIMNIMHDFYVNCNAIIIQH